MRQRHNRSQVGHVDLNPAAVLCIGIRSDVVTAGGRVMGVTALGATCAALLSHLLYASGKATDDPRLAWLSVGTTVALLGLLATLFALPSLFADGGPISQSADAGAARYLVWHAALPAAAIVALAGVEPRLRSLLIFGGLGALLLAWAAVSSSPFGELASGDGYAPAMRALVALIVVAQAGVAVVWWRRTLRRAAFLTHRTDISICES